MSQRRDGNKIVWWTRELSTLKDKVRKKRMFQKKDGSADVCERKEEYKRALNEYKCRMRRDGLSVNGRSVR